MSAPLAGVRILDLTAALAGPAATQRLADWGADVVKIEPAAGEFTRRASIEDAWLGGETTVFLSLNRNKRSVVLDLKEKAGRDHLLALAAGADVFVHNFRPGVTERLGLEAGDLQERNPDIVYAFVSGYGTAGPDSRRPGQDLLLQAYAGVLFTVGSDAERPQPSPVFVADVLASHQLASGILAALLGRERGGGGEVVEVSMLGAMLDSQLQELVTFLNLDIPPRRPPVPTAHAMLNPPYGVYETADGWIAIAMAEPAVLGRALESAEIEAVGSWREASRNRELIFRAASAALRRRPTEEWLRRLDEHGLWAGPVHRYEDLPGNEQIAANGYFADVPLPGGGVFQCPDRAVVFHRAGAADHRPPPRLGADTEQLLTNGWEGE